MGKGVGENGLMGLKRELVLLALVFTALMDGVYGKRNTASVVSKELEVERQLKLLNKPAAKSIQSEDGDIIDCVDIYNQPALTHPLLKNHTIYMRPGHGLQGTKEKPYSPAVISQVWRKSGNCTSGTVAIRRVQRPQLLKASSLENYGRKSSHFVYNPNSTSPDQEHAVGILLTEGYSYSGAKADINVWIPNVESDDEYSNAMIFLRKGPYDDFDAIEAGWGVNPTVYGDRRTRLSTYWTSDASQKTGCFDILCPGFVQTSHEVALGSAIEPTSESGGPQYTINLYVSWDPDTDSWWLLSGEETVIGYWPSTIFNSMKNSASIVMWGGEVYSKSLQSPPHTATWMGNGHFSQDIPLGPCFMYALRIRDNSLVWKYPEWTDAYENQYNCYDAFNLVEGHPDPVFYFGGPGRSLKCP